jgi:Fe-S-cluster-containing dehydrogenase component
LPLLAALDARGRADLCAQAKRRVLGAGQSIFGPGDPADSVCVVESGSVLLEAPGERPTAEAGELFGREAFVSGAARSGRALAAEASVVLEIPAGALRRALARAGASELFAKEETRARERVWIGLLAGTPLGARLPRSALAELVASGREEQRAGGALLSAGEPAEFTWIVLRGLVELSRQRAGSIAGVDSYAAAGDWIGFREALAGGCYGLDARALGDVALLRIPAQAFARLASAHPDAVAHAEHAAEARREKQRRVWELSRGRATRLAFDELERLESARSLLAIDLDSCVRCGHCAKACADAHGTARLLRRGEKVALAVRDGDGSFGTRALLLANACQHCRDPACLPECPTGAIARSADGAVVVRADLCTGCGACAKACPWDAIRMTPRTLAPRTEGKTTELVASKCDLCQGLDGPECVSACPTGALFRADPRRDLIEVRSLLGGRSEEAPRVPRTSFVRFWLVLVVLPPLVALARLAAEQPSPALRLTTGLLAGLACAALALHAGLKRVRLLRDALRRRWPGIFARRGLQSLVTLHSLTGLGSMLLVLSHAGFSVPRGSAGVLALVFWLVALSGAAGAALYRLVPLRLARLERRASLPEDRPAEREELCQALFDHVSGQNAAVKVLAGRVLVPYASSFSGALGLFFSGRSLAAEESALRARIEHLLGGRGSERLAELDKLVNVAVALRALRVRALLETLLGAWLPLHAVGVAFLFGLLALHVAGAIR